MAATADISPGESGGKLAPLNAGGTKMGSEGILCP